MRSHAVKPTLTSPGRRKSGRSPMMFVPEITHEREKASVV